VKPGDNAAAVTTTASSLATPARRWSTLVLGWLPVVALMAVLMMAAHDEPLADALPAALRLVAVAALLGLAVRRFTRRRPWPHPMRAGFVAGHLLAALLYAVAWIVSYSAIESAWQRQLVIAVGPGLAAFVITGMVFYGLVATVAYANQAAQRSAQLQALQARAELAALRAQLHPHFLFNALHTVVQLIPVDPRGASRAAELLAGVLRSTLDVPDGRVTLDQEWSLVERYLEIERIRFGDRLQVRAGIEPAAMSATLPSFALQTLVENAVRHAASERVEPTTLRLQARLEGDVLAVEVDDDGPGCEPAAVVAGGTGLARLRQRLSWLHGTAARIAIDTAPGRGFHVRLRVPQDDEGEA